MKDSLVSPKENKKPSKKKSPKQHIPKLLYGVFIVFFLLVILKVNLYILEKTIHLEKLSQVPFVTPSPPFYPKIVSRKEAPELSAQASVVIDNDSKVVLFDKNPHLRFSMASTTKIMTALIALESFKLNDVITIKTNSVAGVRVGFVPGEKLTVEEALYAMLLPSGNDAAVALSQNYPGGTPAFVLEMNRKAESLYLSHTHFSDPAGLDDDGDYTTAEDLGRLASYAMKNPHFSKIVGTKHATITTLDDNTYKLENLNKLLGIEGVNGIKTGFTDEAGQVLVTSVSKDGHTFIIVVMKSEDRFEDTKKLISYLAGNVSFQSIRP